MLTGSDCFSLTTPLTSSLWSLSAIAHCNGFATGLPDLPALGRDFWVGFFPLNEWQHSPAMLTRTEFILWRAAWEHSPCSMVWAKGAPCSQHTLTLLSWAPTNKAAHTHGCSGDQDTGAKPANKPIPQQTHQEKWLIYPLLFCASSCGKSNREQPEVSAMHLQFHISIIIWLPCATTLILMKTRADQMETRRLKQHKDVKSQVLFSILREANKHTYLLTDISVVFPGWKKCSLDIISTRNWA